MGQGESINIDDFNNDQVNIASTFINTMITGNVSNINKEPIKNYLLLSLEEQKQKNDAKIISKKIFNNNDINNDINHDDVDDHNNTMLSLLCEAGVDDDAYKYIETTSLTNVDHVNDYGNTPFMAACKNNMAKTADLLMKKYKDKCKPENVNKLGRTALIYGCMNNLINIVTDMTNVYGLCCLPGHIDSFGTNALFHTCYRSFDDLGALLLDKFGLDCKASMVHKKTKFTSLIYATKHKSIKIINKLIKLGDSDASQISIETDTALLWLCYGGLNKQAFELLKVYGNNCNIDVTDRHEHTALMYLCKNKCKNIKLIKKLIELNCDVGFTSKDNMSAFLYSCVENLKEISNLLLNSNRMNFDKCVDPDFHPITLICKNDWDDMFYKLIDIIDNISDKQYKIYILCVIDLLENDKHKQAITLIDKFFDSHMCILLLESNKFKENAEQVTINAVMKKISELFVKNLIVYDVLDKNDDNYEQLNLIFENIFKVNNNTTVVNEKNKITEEDIDNIYS